MARKKVSAAHKQAVKQLWRTNRKAAEQHTRSAKLIARLDADGKDPLEFCSYCGATSALRHQYHSNRCVDCGKLYDRWRKAKRRGIDAELRRLRPVLLQRMDRARALDKVAAQRVDNFYNQVKETTMEKTFVAHKVCKQCGRDLLIGCFRKYTPRGTGAYKTTQGHYTICKDCEAISSRAAAALRRGDQGLIDKLTEYYRNLDAKGLPPVTAPAKRLLGVDTSRSTQADKLDDLMSATLGLRHSNDAVETFCEKLHNRDFESADEAYEQLKVLTDALKAAGLYEDMNELVEEWFDADD